MQPASSSASGILKDDDGRIYGVVLGADYTSEHEWGVKRLKSLFGMPTGRTPFADMISTIVPEIQHFDASHVETDHSQRKPVRRDVRSACLWTDHCDGAHVRTLAKRFGTDQSIAGAWDERHFAVRGYGNEGIAAVGTIREAIETTDLALWLGGSSNPFGRGGLVIVRHSLVPAAMSSQFDDALAESIRLREAAEATGIAVRVAAGVQSRYGAPWMALSPAWTPESRRGDTVHPVVFWLNPTEQDRVNYGWFTVEELDQWIAGEGPIPKKPGKAGRSRR